MFRDRGVELKTPAQLDRMREAGLVVARTLEMLRDAARPGMTTGDLDALAEEHIRGCGALPSFLGYGDPPFRGTICASVNDEVVHGVPGRRRLADGDLISLDCGAIVDGWHGDAAITVSVGTPRPAAEALVAVTEEALWRGVAAVRRGGRVSDISAAVERSVGRARRPDGVGGYGIVREYTGHGIGSAMHQPPDVPNQGRAGKGPRLVPGLALAIEPMVVAGSPEVELLDDEWTVVTRDGSLAAHVEHTVALTAEGPWVLTALDGGRERLAALGVPYGGH